jgi:hypothetical protein
MPLKLGEREMHAASKTLRARFMPLQTRAIEMHAAIAFFGVPHAHMRMRVRTMHIYMHPHASTRIHVHPHVGAHAQTSYIRQVTRKVVDALRAPMNLVKAIATRIDEIHSDLDVHLSVALEHVLACRDSLGYKHSEEAALPCGSQHVR